MFRTTEPVERFGDIRKFSKNFIELSTHFQNPDLTTKEEHFREFLRQTVLLEKELPKFLLNLRKSFVREPLKDAVCLSYKFYAVEAKDVSDSVTDFVVFFKTLFRAGEHSFTWQCGGFECKFSAGVTESGSVFVVKVPELDLVLDDIRMVEVYYREVDSSYMFRCVGELEVYFVYADPKYIPF